MIKLWMFSTYGFSLLNNYLILELYVSELIYLTVALGGSSIHDIKICLNYI